MIMATTFTARANIHSSSSLAGDVSTKTSASAKGEYLLNKYRSTAVVYVTFTLTVRNRTTTTQNCSLRVYIGDALKW
jgi:hypothetical protein